MDILILIYLSFKIYNKAEQYDQKPWQWVLRLVSLFISTELVIGLLIVNQFGMDKLLYAVVPSLFLAGLSAYFVFQQLNRKISFNEHNRMDDLMKEEENNKPNLDHFR